MRFYTQRHKFDCGIDRHAWLKPVCMHPDPEQGWRDPCPLGYEGGTRTISQSYWPLPGRSRRLCRRPLHPGTWAANLWAREGLPFVLGQALDMKAIHEGKAKNDTIDVHKIAVLLRGRMLPQTYIYPADMRATRDLLRRRMPCMRKRAELLPHIQKN
jgi:hypothetical protein